jgi:hypothetical protein
MLLSGYTEGPEMANRRTSADIPLLGGGGAAVDGRRVLLIDLPPDMVATIPGVARMEQFSARYQEVDIDLIARHDPELVLAPLVGMGFDILDVGALLLRCGYLGPLRALTAPLPNLQSIRSEVRGHCIGLDFDFMVMRPPAELGH